MHEIERWPRCTLASCEFEHAFHREPKPGDLLRWEHVFAIRGPKVNALKFTELISAWQRRIQELPCPLKFEGGRLLKRRPGGAWTEDFTVGGEAHWWNVECEARGVPDHSAPIWQPNLLATMPSILGVTFTGLMNGKHACRPATDEELKRAETDEFFRAVLCTKPTTDPPAGSVWIRHRWTGFYYDVPEASVAAETEGQGALYTKDLEPQ